MFRYARRTYSRRCVSKFLYRNLRNLRNTPLSRELSSFTLCSHTYKNPHSVKTRIQLDPKTYNKGLIGGFRQVIAKEGAGALLTGFGPTFTGYFLQGAFKFGGYEFFKKQCIDKLGYETASANRTAVYLGSSASAEFFASIALCPLEATRIRLVSEPTYASGLISGFGKILKNEGIGAFYAGFGPILFKQ